MSMKRFLTRHRKDEDNESTNNSRQSIGSFGSNTSLKEIQMFDESKMENDASLNLNPSILNHDQSVLTKESNFNKSIFSNTKKTLSTNQSSYLSKSQTKAAKQAFEYGQALHVLDIKEEPSNENPIESIRDKLDDLSNDMAFIVTQYTNSNVNLSSAVINTIDLLKRFVSVVNNLQEINPVEYNFDCYNNHAIRKIMKIYLNFYDNLLQDDAYIKLKLLLVKNFNDFSQTLNSSASKRFSINNPGNINKPRNFAIGCNSATLPNEQVIVNIINKMATSTVKVKEQNGSFIAPIVRGISKKLNILCLYFGYPNPTDYHLKLTQSLHDLYDDIHILVVKNKIDLASVKIPPSMPDIKPEYHTPPSKFKLPFRVPSDTTKPPMSLSLSIENASRTSGTMGGFIYPIINTKEQPHLESYANSKFAISCGHVCLNNNDDHTEYPHVSAPSSVLIHLYKKALTQQYEKLSQVNESSIMEAQVAYSSVLKQVDKMFPLKRVKITKNKEDHYEIRNLPVHRFGQIIWGERILLSMKNNAKRLSDLAIIKVNKNLTCDQNYLGDDIAFNEFDPGLMFDNLYVRKVIDLKRDPTVDVNDVNDVDDTVFDKNTYAGLPVFKYGSTTKFTQGNLNGIKLVYWLDGAIHSSEFVINSIDNNTAFAAGGDSGSWILAKLDDCNSKDKGLGVLGMLHSYDGEFRQFGLFTPMCEILERLQEVTKIKWGVVGVNEKDNSKLPHDVESDHDPRDSDIESLSSLSDEEYDFEPREVD